MQFSRRYKTAHQESCWDQNYHYRPIRRINARESSNKICAQLFRSSYVTIVNIKQDESAQHKKEINARKAPSKDVPQEGGSERHCMQPENKKRTNSPDRL